MIVGPVGTEDITPLNSAAAPSERTPLVPHPQRGGDLCGRDVCTLDIVSPPINFLNVLAIASVGYLGIRNISKGEEDSLLLGIHEITIASFFALGMIVVAMRTLCKQSARQPHRAE